VTARLAAVALGVALVAVCAGPGDVRADSAALGALELVDPDVLRVCADPRSLPFSNEAGEGFENRIAELVAGILGKGVSYTYFPQGIGFVRNTLGAYKCDIIMGDAQGDELVQGTNPYYRTAYAIVFPTGSGLDGITTLDDPRLADLTLGVVAGTPPASALVKRGLIGKAKPYALMVDTRFESPVADMFADLDEGKIDAALAWGPMAGYFAKKAGRPMTVVPLTHENGGPRMTYRITMGVRASDQEWKRTLNRLIRDHQDEIDAILLDYGVPLLDENDRPITPKTN
jgi:quinoprotein dehydrogenase-associated probable ABC transporter substrate-binding protein